MGVSLQGLLKKWTNRTQPETAYGIAMTAFGKLAGLFSRSKNGLDAAGTFFCKLFSDRVTMHLCDIRKKELNTQGGFSCDGCSVEGKQRKAPPGTPALRSIV